MIEMPLLPDYVKLVLAPNPSMMTGPGTNSFVIGAAPTGAVILDPGPADQQHLERLAWEAAQLGGAKSILITHGHHDHSEGARALAELTGAPILAWSQEGVPEADQELHDGQILECGPDRLRVIHTPGHRFDHVCLYLEEARVLFAGDLVAGVGTVVIIPPEGNVADYLASLRQLLALDIRLLVPAHGPAITSAQAKLQEYIDHRMMREQQILDALASGPKTIPAMVQSIYSDVDPRLHEMAGLSVHAHLLKLESDRRVSHDEQTPHAHWRLN
ncbi:MAG TPA: MBL fold metallo-hydrolase [Ktedonobacterales bacterium]|jgi:glyoxylase-like metal-dependent hydrolase (beta-lactamase superfamily II)